ncbi:hypothetical protein [Micromonospora echinospora]|uniref:hypothetical protein n=1 Tax=Micromonospora echinospora TaxID=1877 RepID=UPI000B5AE747
MRVLAALADVKKMKEAILAGEDLHTFTARLALGEEVWASLTGPEKKRFRKLFKGAGFGKVYGGGLPRWPDRPARRSRL